MTGPSVSIIIPCYNGEQYLPEFFNSLFSQDYAPVEILFADDGSSDQTGNICRQYEKKMPHSWSFKYFRQEHAGQAAAVSGVLKHISGEFLMWSDADDVMLPGSIQRKVEFLLRHPNCDMVRNDFYCFRDDKMLINGYSSDTQKGEQIFEKIFNGTLPCHAGTYMMRSSLLLRCYPEKKMPFSEEGQNFQLLLPAASRSRCGFIDEPLMKYRIHADSHSNRPRSISEQFRRVNGFFKLRKDLLPYCDCNQVYFKKLAEELFEKQKKEIVFSVVSATKRGVLQKEG